MLQESLKEFQSFYSELNNSSLNHDIIIKMDELLQGYQKNKDSLEVTRLYQTILEELAVIPAIKASHSPLMFFARKEYSHLFFDLLKRQPDIHVLDEEGYDALMFACTSGTLEQVKALLDRKISAKTISKHGITALMRASFRGDEKIVHELLLSGAEVDAQDPRNIENMTALMYAATQGHIEVMKLLIKHGANINLTRRYDRSAHQTCILNLVMHDRSIGSRHIHIQHQPDSQDKHSVIIQPRSQYAHSKIAIIHFLIENGADIFFKEQLDNEIYCSVINTASRHDFGALIYYHALKQTDAKDLTKLNAHWDQHFEKAVDKDFNVDYRIIDIYRIIIEHIQSKLDSREQAAVISSALNPKNALYAFLDENSKQSLTDTLKTMNILLKTQTNGTTLMMRFSEYSNHPDDNILEKQSFFAKNCAII